MEINQTKPEKGARGEYMYMYRGRKLVTQISISCTQKEKAAGIKCELVSLAFTKRHRKTKTWNIIQ